MKHGRAKLVRRVTLLDARRQFQKGPPSLRDDIEHFTDVMERITSSSNNELYAHLLPRATPNVADAVMNTSRLLARLEDAMPEIVTGPLMRDAQYWISWSTSGQHRTRQRVIDQAHFVGILDAPEVRPSTKPFHVGLFTSTAVLDTYGMWYILLEPHRDVVRVSGEPGLYDPPWDVWTVEPEPDAAVCEITSAVQWVDFVTAYPRLVPHRKLRGRFPRRPPGEIGPVLYPDWKAAAERWHAVHMTLRAIAATQGVYFPTARGVIAPTFWDVESTFWLRWCFRSVRYVETIE